MINKTEEEIIKKWNGILDKPFVSIICATYNHEAYIKDALDGFLMQDTEFPFEIIIHDDASTDNTANIIKKYELLYPKIIKPIYELENQYSKNIVPTNLCLKKARGKYIAYCEGDDYWICSDKLRKQINFLEKNDEYVAVGHMTKTINRSGEEIFAFIDSKPGEYTIDDNNDGILFAHYSSWVTRRIEAIPHYIDLLDLKVPGDRKIPLFFLSVGKLYVLPDYCSIYRYQSTPNSFTSQKSTKLGITIYRQYIEMIKLAKIINIDVDYEEPKKRALMYSLSKLIKFDDFSSFFKILKIRNNYFNDICYCFKMSIKILLEKMKVKNGQE